MSFPLGHDTQVYIKRHGNHRGRCKRIGFLQLSLICNNTSEAIIMTDIQLKFITEYVRQNYIYGVKVYYIFRPKRVIIRPNINI